MQIAQTFIVTAVIAVGLGCGYSKSNMPPQPGIMPAITQLNPPSQVAGSASFPLEVDGTNFAGNAVINFNGVKQTPTTVSATKLTTMIPATAVMNAGSVPVTVTNPGTPGGPYGGGTLPVTSAAVTFTIN